MLPIFCTTVCSAILLADSTALLGSLLDSQLMYAFPLIIAVSLVYGATRHEEMSKILAHAARGAIWITVFMTIIFGVLLLIGRSL